MANRATQQMQSSVQELRETLIRSTKEPAYFMEHMVNMEVYDYNKDFVNDLSQFIIYRSGRKAGKTVSTAMKIIWYAYFAPYVLPNIDHTCDILIIAPAQHQAQIMMDWIKTIILNCPLLKANVVKERLEEIHLQFIDGGGVTKIRTRAAGLHGASVRGYEPNVLVIDECAFVSRNVIIAMLPSGLASKAKVMLTSSPFGSQGYFHEKCMLSRAGNELARKDGFHKPDGRWVQYYVPSTINPKIKSNSEYLEEMKTMTQDEYDTEVLGKFIDVGDALFPQKYLQMAYGQFAMPKKFRLYMGVDVARKGKDETVITVIATDYKDRVYVVYCKSIPKSSIPEVAREVARVYDMYQRFGGVDRIFYDSTALGSGACDISAEDGLPVVEIPFSLQKKAKMYVNLVTLFELGNIKIGENQKLMYQLSYMRKEYTQKWLNPQSDQHDDYPDSLALACMAVVADEEFDLIRDAKGNPMDLEQLFG